MTTHAEAIKTLEALKRHSEHVVRLNKDHDKVFDDDVNALTLAIDALTVVEYAEKTERTLNPPLNGHRGYGWEVNGIEAPTLSELAAKLKELP